jgi:hypothetical protein
MLPWRVLEINEVFKGLKQGMRTNPADLQRHARW